MLRLWLVALLALLVVAAPAQAGGTLMPDRYAVGGPQLAGGGLVWASHSPAPDGYRIHRAALDGGGETVRTIEAPISRFGTNDWFAFGASDRRAAVSLHLVHCEPACKYQYYEFPYSKVLSAAGDGQFEPFGTPCQSPYAAYASVAVEGDVVAYLGCSNVNVRDFAAGDGEQRDFSYPGSMRVRLAGAYLATAEGQQVVVREWRTGAERLRVPVSSSLFDVQADGTLAVIDRERRVMVASPGEPTPRVVAEDGGGEIRVVGDRLAYRRAAGGGVAVRRLDGSLVAESPTADLSDFDGERIAWLDRTCARSAIATWDLQGAAPSLPRADPCPIASLRSTTLRLGPPGTGGLPVKLSCAPEPAVGCGGQIVLLAKDSRRKNAGRMIDLATGGYGLRPGEKGTGQVTFGKNRICIAGRNAIRPILQMTGPPKPDGTGYRIKKRRVKIVGLEDAIAACPS